MTTKQNELVYNGRVLPGICEDKFCKPTSNFSHLTSLVLI